MNWRTKCSHRKPFTKCIITKLKSFFWRFGVTWLPRDSLAGFSKPTILIHSFWTHFTTLISFLQNSVVQLLCSFCLKLTPSMFPSHTQYRCCCWWSPQKTDATALLVSTATGELVSDLSHLPPLFIREDTRKAAFQSAHTCLESIIQKLQYHLRILASQGYFVDADDIHKHSHGFYMVIREHLLKSCMLCFSCRRRNCII